MITGITFTASYIIFFKFVHPELNTAEYWWWGISPEGIGTLGMGINFLVAWVVFQFTPPAPRKIQVLVNRIRMP